MKPGTRDDSMLHAEGLPSRAGFEKLLKIEAMTAPLRPKPAARLRA